MKLLKTIVIPMLILCVSSSLAFAEEGLLSRILPLGKEAPKTAEAAPESAAPGSPAPAVVSQTDDKSTVDKDKKKCAYDCKNLKRSTDPMVEELEEQVWICQVCPCMIVVKKAGPASLHHCGKPMCLKADKNVAGDKKCDDKSEAKDNDADDNDADDKDADDKDAEKDNDADDKDDE